MRTIIAGSRHATDYFTVATAIRQCPWRPTVVISGGRRGVDALGEQWAARDSVKVEIYPAGRNLEIANRAEALIAIWDGESRGTQHMIAIARRAGLKVYVHRVVPRVPPHKQVLDAVKSGKIGVPPIF